MLLVVFVTKSFIMHLSITSVFYHFIHNVTRYNNKIKYLYVQVLNTCNEKLTNNFIWNIYLYSNLYHIKPEVILLSGVLNRGGLKQ